MIGLDTNVLVRYLVEDDPEQAARTMALIEHASESGEHLFVPQIVLCEIVWVLDSVFRFSRDRIASVLGNLLRSRQLVIEDANMSRRALERYTESSGDFADYLIVERCRAAGCERVASFDTGLASEDGVFEP